MKRLAYLLVFLPVLAVADNSDGKKYLLSETGTAEYGSAAQACQAGFDQGGFANPPNNGTDPAPADQTATAFSCTYNYRPSGLEFPGTYFSFGGSIVDCELADFEPGGPCAAPPPEECDAEIGHGFWTISTEPISGSSWCNGMCQMTAETSQCGKVPGMTPTCTTWTSVTALSCSGSSDTDGDGLGDDGSGDGPADAPPGGADPGEDGTGQADAPSDAGENCVAVGDGEYCASPSGGGQCGYVNDTYTCLDKIKDDECKTLADGGRVCGSEATTTPPVPDNGTPGQLATPDGQVSQTAPGASPGIGNGTTNNYNYYSSGTVAGSARDPGSTGASAVSGSGSPHAPIPGAGGSGDGDGDGGGGECEGDGCTAGPLPELAEIGTMTEAFTAFWGQLQEVPIVAAGAEIAPSFVGGSCPDWSTSVALYSASINIDFTNMCGLWTSIASTLTFVCLVMWGFLAFRVLFSA